MPQILQSMLLKEPRSVPQTEATAPATDIDVKKAKAKMFRLPRCPYYPTATGPDSAVFDLFAETSRTYDLDFVPWAFCVIVPDVRKIGPNYVRNDSDEEDREC